MTPRPSALLLSALLTVGLVPAAASADAVATADTTTDTTTQVQQDSRVVVAPIDSGINPYHERFRVGADTSVTPEVLEEFGITPDRVLTTTTYEADLAAGLYEGLQEGVDYWFEGTNIIARSTDFGSRPLLPDNESDTHGTGVAGSIQAANPEAIIYFHEGVNTANESHAFAHPAVDLVSTSYGFLTAAPLGDIAGSYEGTVEGGKLHFGANPNDPSAGPLDSTGGPWWGLSISGFEEGDANGKAVMSGSAPEYVADFTQDLPYCATCEEATRSVSGTSFATPTSAGILSHAILELRREAGHVGGITEVDGTPYVVHGEQLQLTNWDLRRALEESAAIPTVGEYDVLATDPILGEAYPNLPAGGYTLYGWGLLTTDPERDSREAIVEYVRTGEATQTADACAYMTAHFDARVAAWQSNPTAAGFGEDAADYERC